MPVDSKVITQEKINDLSEKNKAFQNRFNRVADIINKNQRYLEEVQDPTDLDLDQKLALKCLKDADFDLDKAINTFMIRKGEGQGEDGTAQRRTAPGQSDEMSPSRPSGSSLLRGTADLVATVAPFVRTSQAWSGAEAAAAAARAVVE